MMTLMKSLRTRSASGSFALVMSILVVDTLTGCGDSGPCHGAECGSNSMGSGNFTPGPFPHSASALDAARCHTGGVEIGLFLDAMFTDPDPPQPVHPADPLRVYWSVCNSGLTDAPAQPNSYTLTPTLQGPPSTPLATTQFGIPALTHCTCDVPSQVFQNVLTPGTYIFALSGAVTGSVNRNITP
jgi:hypothetical protein